MSDIEWTNEKRKISQLMPNPKNPRKISDEQMSHLKKSIQKFNYAETVVINLDNEIISGHMRLKAMALLGRGEEEIDVRVPSRMLTADEAKELLIRSNANTGDWDFNLMVDFDFEALASWGFDADKIDRIREKVKEDDFDSDAHYHQIVVPTAKKGDLYLLGRHKLLCGDSMDRGDYVKLFKEEKAQLIFTDPPYSVAYKSVSGNSYSDGKFDSKEVFDDDKNEKETFDFYVEVLKNLYEFTTSSAVLYWWLAESKRGIQNRLAWIEAGWRFSQSIIWLKEGIAFGRGWDYLRAHEPCMYGWKKDSSHFVNKKLPDTKDILLLAKEDFDVMIDVWYEKRDKTSEYVHPTQKPVRLAERALRKNSKTGDIVLDAFGGSGSTLMACEQMDRSCYVIELDPKYIDVIVARWEKFTSKQAELVKSE